MSYSTRGLSSKNNGVWADDLLANPVPPAQGIVDGLLFPGLNVLAGPPKGGKTNLAFQAALSIVRGQELFPGMAARQGGILIFALEEDQTLTSERLAKMLKDASLPQKSIRVEYSIPLLGHGGAGHIGLFLQNNPGTRLVVLDVLQRAKGGGRGSYASDYNIAVTLQRLGLQSDTAILVLHHTTKKIPPNWQAAQYGTQGLSGVADVSMLLDRPNLDDQGRLCVTGRKCPTREWAVQFDAETLLWRMLREVKDTDLTPERQAILEAFLDPYGPKTPIEIARATGLKNSSIFNMLQKLRKQGLVQKRRRSYYGLTAAGVVATKKQ